MKRYFAFFLCLVMCLSLLPAGALAEETELLIPEEEVEALPAALDGEDPEDIECDAEDDVEILTDVLEDIVPFEPEETEEPEEEAEDALPLGDDWEIPILFQDISGNCGTNLTWTLTTSGSMTISGTGAMTAYADEDTVPWNYYAVIIQNVTIADGVTSIGSYAFSGATQLTDVELAESVTGIGYNAFYGCTSIENVSYPLTASDFGKISIAEGNTELTEARLVCGRYTVSFDANGGSGAPSAMTVAAGEALTLPTDAPSLEGSDFLGWADSETATAPVYEPGESCVFEGDITLFAVWKSSGVSVLFKDNYYAAESYKSNRFTAFTIRLQGEDAPRAVNTDARDIALEVPVGSSLVFEICGTTPKSGKYSTDKNTTCYSYTFTGSTMGGKSISSLPYTDETEQTEDGTILHRWYRIDSVTGDLVIKVKLNLNKYAVTVTGEAADKVTLNKSQATYRSSYSFTITEDVEISAITAGGKSLTAGTAYEVSGTTVKIFGGYIRGDIVIYAVYHQMGQCGANLTWRIDEEGTLFISGVGAMYNYSMSQEELLLQPWKEYRKNIKAVVINEGATSVGNYAFDNCPNLASVSLPDTLKKIGSYAFSSCSKLTAVQIPESVTSLGTWTFYMCRRLASVNIPSGVTKIGESLFNNCPALTSIELPSGITTIGETAFIACTNLAEINIPANVSSIGENAFSSCRALTSIELPENIDKVEKNAFSECTGLQELILHESLGTVLGEYAFANCDALTEVTVPKGVELGNGTFADCAGLTEINTGENNLRYSSVGGVLYNKDGTKLVQYPAGLAGAYTVPDGVKAIGDSAFFGCEGLTGVILPEGLTGIGDYAFFHCGIDRAEIPDTVSSIGECAFSSCETLTSVTLPASLTYIDNGTFCYSPALSELLVPVSVTAVGESAFFGCDGLTTIYYTGTRTQWNSISKGEDNEILADTDVVCEYSPYYTVTYNAGDGEGAPEPQTVKKGKALTLSDKVPTREGYKFVGWTTESGSRTVDYDPGDEYIEGEDMTLFAVWRMPGDVTGDGKVNTKDFVTLMRYCAGETDIACDRNAIDIDRSGKVDTLDFVMLMQYIAGAEIILN